VRYGVAERLMLADVSEQLFGHGSDVATKLGRFVLLDELGAGGMGRVVRAYDPELDRSLALKVLRRDASDVAMATTRLRVEALALARLNHPNVVTIHEVLEVGDELVLAMELVDGQDLGRWSSKHRPTRPFVQDDRFRTALGYLRQAGVGLAAAHAAGLVHRDFKPSNVLVGNDGRVRVADFGLARAADDHPTIETPPSTPVLSTHLTGTGRVSGTPRYMAPEQQVGDQVDARTDQYAFCITAWEVLFGDHPWGGAMPRAKLPTPPAGVPSKLAQTLLRGLAKEPAERHASMEALLVALPSERPSASSAHRIAIAAGCAAAITGLAMAFVDMPDACGGAREKLDGIWDDAAKTRVRATMEASELPYARASWTQLEGTLDAYADRWTQAHEETCTATEVRHEQSSHMMDAKMACLTQRRRALAAFVDVVAEGTPGAIQHAGLGAAELPRIETCREDDSVIAGFEAPSTEDVDAARDALARAAALRRTSEYARAGELLEDVRPRVEALAFPPLAQELALERARLAADLGEWEVETERLLAAYAGAARSGRTALAVDSASLLASALARAGEQDDGQRWLTIATSTMPDTPEATLASDVAARRGTVAIMRGDYPGAAAAFEDALSVLEREVGPDDVRLAQLHRELANALGMLARFDDADRHFARALELARTLGERHPVTASILAQKADLAMKRGDFAGAEAMLMEALTIVRETYGNDAAQVATPLTGLGIAARALGRNAEALERLAEAEAIYADDDTPLRRTNRAYALGAAADVLSTMGRIDEGAAKAEQALALLRTALPPKHPHVAAAIHNLAMARMRQGRGDDAVRLFQESRDLLMQILGPEHPTIAIALGSWGAALNDLGRHAEAIEVLQRQLALIEKTAGVTSPMRGRPLYNLGLAHALLGELEAAESSFESSLAAMDREDESMRAYPLVGLADVLVETGRADRAVDACERALQVIGNDGDAMLRAQAKATLARALWSLHRDRDRARVLADEAEAAYRELGASAPAELVRFTEWRTKHGL
jgi:tetratricopeptide (TPR) repeat protein